MSRRAVVHLGMDQIARMLALPEGVRAIAARDDFIRNGVAVLVEGEQLEDQPDAIVLPDLPLSVLDPSALAMRARIEGWGATGSGGDVDVWCPLDCPWKRTFDCVTTLAQVAGAVQQHITEAHAGEQS